MLQRSLKVKVSYLLEQSTQPVMALTRLVPVSVLDDADCGLPEDTKYGKVALRHCLDAICRSNPDLIADRSRDFSVYAHDPLEPVHAALSIPTNPSGSGAPSGNSSGSSIFANGPAIGMGLMSWCLSTEVDDDDDDHFVIGSIFSHPGMGEALQVLLALRSTATRTRSQQQSLLKEWSKPEPAPRPPQLKATATAPSLMLAPPQVALAKTMLASSSPVPPPSRPAVTVPPTANSTAAGKRLPRGKKPLAATTSTPVAQIKRESSSPFPAGMGIPPGYPYGGYYFPQVGPNGQPGMAMPTGPFMPPLGPDGMPLPQMTMDYAEAYKIFQNNPQHAWSNPRVSSALMMGIWGLVPTAEGTPTTPAPTAPKSEPTPTASSSAAPAAAPRFTVPDYVKPPVFTKSVPASTVASAPVAQKENVAPRGTKRTIEQAMESTDPKPKKRPSPTGSGDSSRGKFTDASNASKVSVRPIFARPATPKGARPLPVPPPSSSPLFSPPPDPPVHRARTGSTHSRSSSEAAGSSTPTYTAPFIRKVGTSSPTRPSSPTPGARRAVKDLPPSSPLPPTSDTDESDMTSAGTTPASDQEDSYDPVDDELASELFLELQNVMVEG